MVPHDAALGLTLVVLLTMGIAVARLGHIPVSLSLATAAVRAVVQLAAVSLIIATVRGHTWSALLFAGAMFSVATATAAGRVGARRNIAWVALAPAAGALPVLVVIFALQAADWSGPAIVSICGIIIGGTMTAHTLAARRAFDAIRSDRGQVLAALGLGLKRRDAISLVISRHAREALNPAIDQTRTVGLVTLPGAFVGVLLGGGSARDAAAAQVLVLVGLLAAETCVVEASQRLICSGRILPADVRESIPPR
jgi:putative ABC transport system permease protein